MDITALHRGVTMLICQLIIMDISMVIMVSLTNLNVIESLYHKNYAFKFIFFCKNFFSYFKAMKSLFTQVKYIKITAKYFIMFI